MSDSVDRLLVRIDATTEQLRRELKKADDAVASSSTKVERAVERINKSFSGLGLIIGAAGLGLAFKNVVAATAEQERVTAQLNATLASTGGAAGKSAEELIKTAAGLQKVTRFGDEAIVRMQSLLLTFKEIKGDNFDRTTKAVLDMSTAMGQDLKSSAVQLGKALNDPITGLSALSRVGVTFSDSQKDIIKNLAETGRVAEAQVLILQELESEFGGSAEAARDTLGGALDGLSNAFGDLFEAQGSALAPMKGSLNELEGILSDPNFVQSAQQITAAMIDIGVKAAEALAAVVDLYNFMKDSPVEDAISFAFENNPAALIGKGISEGIDGLRVKFGLFRDDLDVMGEVLTATSESFAKADTFIKAMSLRVAAADKEIKAGTEELKKLALAAGQTADVTKKVVKESAAYQKTLKDFDKSLAKINAQHAKNTKSLEDSYEALDDMVRAGDRFIEQQEFEIKLLGMTAREQAIANAERDAGTQITEAHAEAIRKNAAAMYDIELAAEQASKATEQMEQAWESSRSTLSNFFFEFARDGKNAFDTLVDGFKAMIAKMIAEAAANQIILGIGTVAGGLGFSGAASAAASSVAGNAGAGFLPSLGSSAAGYFMQNSSLFTNQGLQFAVPGDGGAALGPQFSPSGALYTAGAGLVGGFAGNAVFGGGGYSNIGSTVGGLAGSLYGPLGAGIGSFLGSGLGSLFGGKNNGDNKGRADINLGTGTASVYGVGKSFDQANVDAMEAIVPVLQNIAAALGGSDAILNVSAGNKSGLSLNGQKFGKDEAGFIAAAIDAMVDGATGLSKTLKKLIQGFDGTSEELIAFATSMVSVTELIKDNPVDRAVREFSDAQAIAGRTLMQTYKGQLDALNDLIYGFDGSADGAVTLNNALSINKQLAYDMAMALEAIGASTKSVVKDQVDYFNESVRTPDESLRYMEGQLRFIDAILPKLTDPDQILASRDKALELNKAIFDAGPADLQRANVQTYIDMANTIGEKTATALENATAGLQTSQQDLNQQIGAMLEVAASGFQAPADTMMSAAQMMYLAVQNFINNGGSQYNQVVA